MHLPALLAARLASESLLTALGLCTWIIFAAIVLNMILGAGAKRISQLGDFSATGPSDKEVQALKVGDQPSNFFALSAYFFVGGLAAFAAMFLRRLKGGVERCERFPQSLEFLAKRLFQIEPGFKSTEPRGVVDEQTRHRSDSAENRKEGV